MRLASCKSALNPPVVYSTDRSKAVVPVLVLLFVALWFILRRDLFYVLPCVILFLCFSVLLVLRLPRLEKRELILVFLYVCSICACLDLSVFSSSWCLGRAAVCDCGTPWTFLSPFFLRYIGYRNFINDFIKHVSLLILVHVRLLSYFLLLCGLFYEAICFISYLVSFCSCVFQSF